MRTGLLFAAILALGSFSSAPVRADQPAPDSDAVRHARKLVENEDITWHRVDNIRQQDFTDAFFVVEPSFAGDIVTMDGLVASAKMAV